MKDLSYASLEPPQKELLDAAERAMERAYNPYSHFFVGAALRTLDDEVITAANFENAAHGPSVCAERSALVRANAMGKRLFRAVAVIARGADFETTEVTAPCGICRQVLYEASQLSGCDMEVILATTRKEKVVLTSINELLPLAFGPRDLGIDVKRYQT